MDEEIPEKIVSKPARPASGAPSLEKDLSREIERFVDREPLDLVRCVRVFGNYYRCNWWSRAGSQGGHQDAAWSRMMLDVVRKSSFLTATMDAGELVMKEVVAPGAPLRTVIRGTR